MANKLIVKKIKIFIKIILLENWFFRTLFLSIIDNNLEDCNTVLELGAGTNTYLRKLKKRMIITAFNIHKPSLHEASKNNIYDHYIHGDVLRLMSFFRPNSYDAVVAFDLIEHLQKEKGYELIENMIQIAREKVIIYTPNGFLAQPPTKDNPFQEHLSGWTYEEMRNLDFKVFGINGHKRLSSKYAIPKIKPAVVGNFIRNINWIILKILKHEDKSFSILCVKDITDRKHF